MKIKDVFVDHEETDLDDWSKEFLYAISREEYDGEDPYMRPILQLYKEGPLNGLYPPGSLTLTLFNENDEQIWWKDVKPDDEIPFDEIKKELEMRKEVTV